MMCRLVRKRVVAAIVAVAALTVACSEPQDQVDESSSGFEYVMSRAFEQAERLGASPEQIEILEQARQEGEVSFELYSQAIDNALRCMRAQGHEPYDHGVHEDRGFPERGYSVPTGAEEADPVEFAPGATVHRCIAEHSHSVEGAYQNQPSSLEALEAHDRARFEPHREAIVECAIREGIAIDPDGDIMDIVLAVWEAYDLEQAEVDCTDGTW